MMTPAVFSTNATNSMAGGFVQPAASWATKGHEDTMLRDLFFENDSPVVK